VEPSLKGRLKALWAGLSRRARALPWWAIPLGILAAFTLAALAAGARTEITVALFGLIGTALGGAISAFTGVLSAREQTKANLVSANWQKKTQAHQEAYTKWRRIIKLIHRYDDPERENALDDAYSWWEQNRLYLSANARIRFHTMIREVISHELLIKVHNMESSDENAKEVKENFSRIMSVGPLLIREAGGHISDKMIYDFMPSEEQDAFGAVGEKQHG
jgi:gas vesicle protein